MQEGGEVEVAGVGEVVEVGEQFDEGLFDVVGLGGAAADAGVQVEGLGGVGGALGVALAGVGGAGVMGRAAGGGVAGRSMVGPFDRAAGESAGRAAVGLVAVLVVNKEPVELLGAVACCGRGCEVRGAKAGGSRGVSAWWGACGWCV
ncbi:hypothetical protein GCM10009528_35250 [Kineococcus aurantiacus]